MTIDNLIPRLKQASSSPVLECDSMIDWLAHHQALTHDLDASLSRALIAGAYFRPVSFAFASAYQSALENMFDLDRQSIAALCHNEKGVKKPREMQTRLYEDNGKLKLDSMKGFASGGVNAEILLVSAVDQRPDADGRIVLLKLDNANNKLGLEELPPLPFVPELAHAKFKREGINVESNNILPGDGFSDYVKPFRTEEDCHILSALCGQRLSIALALNQLEFTSQFLASANNILSLQEADRNAACTHLVLQGIKQHLTRLFKEQDKLLEESMPKFAEAWRRDSALLSLAESAQKARTEKAWTSIIEA